MSKSISLCLIQEEKTCTTWNEIDKSENEEEFEEENESFGCFMALSNEVT